MPIPVAVGRPTLFIRKEPFERVGLTRAALDERLNLTADEFRLEGDLIAVGPIHDEDAFGEVFADLERIGLQYFDDFFELSGNWPEWLRLFAMSERPG
jgi:hypothetical protein